MCDEKKGLDKMWLHSELYEAVKNDLKYVTRGSIIKCTLGDQEALIDDLADHAVYTKNQNSLLTCNDCNVNDNIYGFGFCKCTNFGGLPPLSQQTREVNGKTITGRKCFPMLSGKWLQQYQKTVIAEDGEFKTVLVENAVIVCQYGGWLEIVEVSSNVGNDKYEELAEKYGAFSYNSKEDLLNADFVNLIARAIYGEQTIIKGQSAIAWIMANRVLAQSKNEFADGRPSSLYNIITAYKAFTDLDKEGENEVAFVKKTKGEAGYKGWVNAVKLAYNLNDIFTLYYIEGNSIPLTSEEKDFIRGKLRERIGNSPIGKYCWYVALYQWEEKHTEKNGKHFYNGIEINSLYIDIEKNMFYHYTYGNSW